METTILNIQTTKDRKMKLKILSAKKEISMSKIVNSLIDEELKKSESELLESKPKTVKYKPNWRFIHEG